MQSHEHACRADRNELQQLLTAARELPQAPKAMFVHADITGARFNTRQQAHAGIAKDAFPVDIPIYSGHYHLPQTVPNTSITYIGSPFQRALHAYLVPLVNSGSRVHHKGACTLASPQYLELCKPSASSS